MLCYNGQCALCSHNPWVRHERRFVSLDASTCPPDCAVPHLALKPCPVAVMWDSIQSTEEWVLAQLPPLLKGPLSKLMAREGADAPHADYEALTQVLAGAFNRRGTGFWGAVPQLLASSALCWMQEGRLKLAGWSQALACALPSHAGALLLRGGGVPGSGHPVCGLV